MCVQKLAIINIYGNLIDSYPCHNVSHGVALMQKPDLREHWARASESWAGVGQPLRPGEEDQAIMNQLLDKVIVHPGSFEKAVLLGVTPELLSLQWPSRWEVISLDISQEMIERVWSHAARPIGSRAVLGNWKHMPFADRSIDFCLGDGCFVLVPSSEWALVFSEVQRILKPGAHFAIRLFSRPEQREDLNDILRSIETGAITSVHMLKWRIAGSLQGNLGQGVKCEDIWKSYQLICAESLIPFGEPGWTNEDLATLDRYADSDCSLFFPTAGEWLEAITPYFILKDVFTGSYAHAACCQTYHLQAKRF